LKHILSFILPLNHRTSNKLYKLLPELRVCNPLQQRYAVDGDWNDDDLGVNQRIAGGDSLAPLGLAATGPHSASGTVNRHVDKWGNCTQPTKQRQKGGKFREKARYENERKLKNTDRKRQKSSWRERKRQKT